MTYKVTLTACCPSRERLMEVEADDVEEAKVKALMSSNGATRFVWKRWLVSYVVPVENLETEIR